MTYPLPQLVIDATLRGAEAIHAVYNNPREITSKGFRDDVTDADFAAQEAIIAAIHKYYPDHPVVSEENDTRYDLAHWDVPPGYWWLVDPLDGTTNFSRGIPHYCVTVAVLDGPEVLSGAIYDPVRNHLFTATRGEGAQLNGEPIRVSPRADLAEAVVECGLGRGREDRRKGLAIFNALAKSCRTVRSSGSAALAQAYVAAGWTEAYVHLTLKPWDCAAGSLMVAEAGGIRSLPDGGEWHLGRPEILFSNGVLHKPLVHLVKEALATAQLEGAK